MSAATIIRKITAGMSGAQSSSSERQAALNRMLRRFLWLDGADSPSASTAIILPACPRRTPPKPDEEREKEARRRQAAKLARQRGQYLGTCMRNDVLGNLAVLLAAAGVFGTGTGWPDVIVAAIMAGLALQGAWIVVRQSLGELRQPLVISKRLDSERKLWTPETSMR